MTKHTIASVLVGLFAMIAVVACTKSRKNTDRSPQGLDVGVPYGTIVAAADRVVVGKVEHTLSLANESISETTEAGHTLLVLHTQSVILGRAGEQYVIRRFAGDVELSGMQMWFLIPGWTVEQREKDALERLGIATAPEYLWIVCDGLGAPWPLRQRDGVNEVRLPSLREINLEVAMEGMDSELAPKSQHEWLAVELVSEGVTAEVARVTPRVEASLVGSGADAWHRCVQGARVGLTSLESPVEWTSGSWATWKLATESLRLSKWPTYCDQSTGPGAQQRELAVVDLGGRQRYRLSGRSAESATIPCALQFEELWSVFEQVSNQSSGK